MFKKEVSFMADVKRTQKMDFAEVIKALRGEETEVSVDYLVEFIEGRIDVLSRKSGSRKPSKVQVANEKAKEKILEVLSVEGQTVSEIIGKVDFSEFDFLPSSQKVSALLKQMVEAGTVIKTVDKKKSLFSVA
jgi:hypothetical protein